MAPPSSPRWPATLFQREVLGPVLAVPPFDTMKEELTYLRVCITGQGGADLQDGAALEAFCDKLVSCCPDTVRLEQITAHINDAAFAKAALAIFDSWVERGWIPRPWAAARGLLNGPPPLL
ncbi:hypothetical protein [Antarcticimicrobium sediminis]|uniref:Uncharacterized protein n=1 Tax=Antarcticimicrobium sediminis TaxID=2546227 RepID=A0A4R5EWC0_9RHOB|nr:hypothetical protein [Antarcticimicrobium sediminis]TDE39047.1 hypothetical protein E1B25_08550 [Antarcticimicrobium sediminis]